MIRCMQSQEWTSSNVDFILSMYRKCKCIAPLSINCIQWTGLREVYSSASMNVSLALFVFQITDWDLCLQKNALDVIIFPRLNSFVWFLLIYYWYSCWTSVFSSQDKLNSRSGSKKQKQEIKSRILNVFIFKPFGFLCKIPKCLYCSSPQSNVIGDYYYFLFLFLISEIRVWQLFWK